MRHLFTESSWESDYMTYIHQWGVGFFPDRAITKDKVWRKWNNYNVWVQCWDTRCFGSLHEFQVSRYTLNKTLMNQWEDSLFMVLRHKFLVFHSFIKDITYLGPSQKGEGCFKFVHFMSFWIFSSSDLFNGFIWVQNRERYIEIHDVAALSFN